MFELDKAVDRWSREFVGSSCGSGDRIEELKDHLYCEIEKNIEEGLPEEPAFLAATRRFGISEELKDEFRKGRSILSILREFDCHETELRHSNRRIAIFTLVFLVFFASLTFSLAIYFDGTGTFSKFTPWLYIIGTLPIVYALGNRKNAQAECAFVKRIWRKVF